MLFALICAGFFYAEINFRSDLSDEPTESDSGSDYSDQQRRSSRWSD